MHPIEELVERVQRAANKGYLDKLFQECLLLALLILAERLEAIEETLLMAGRRS